MAIEKVPSWVTRTGIPAALTATIGMVAGFEVGRRGHQPETVARTTYQTRSNVAQSLSQTESEKPEVQEYAWQREAQKIMESLDRNMTKEQKDHFEKWLTDYVNWKLEQEYNHVHGIPQKLPPIEQQRVEDGTLEFYNDGRSRFVPGETLQK